MVLRKLTDVAFALKTKMETYTSLMEKEDDQDAYAGAIFVRQKNETLP